MGLLGVIGLGTRSGPRLGLERATPLRSDPGGHRHRQCPGKNKRRGAKQRWITKHPWDRKENRPSCFGSIPREEARAAGLGGGSGRCMGRRGRSRQNSSCKAESRSGAAGGTQPWMAGEGFEKLFPGGQHTGSKLAGHVCVNPPNASGEKVPGAERVREAPPHGASSVGSTGPAFGLNLAKKLEIAGV